MKYVTYCRVSSDREDRQVLGISSQKRELQEIVVAKKLDVVREFAEQASAYKPGRVQFNKMLAMIEAGKVDAILCWHLSRLSRTSLDSGRIIHLMDLGLLKQIRTKDKIIENNANDKFILQIEMAVNKKSSDDTSDYVKRDNIAKIQKGEYPGLVPIGYLNLNKNYVISGTRYDQRKQAMLLDLERPLKRIEIDPMVGPLIKKLLGKAATGEYSLRQLQEVGYEFGIKGTLSGNKLAKASIVGILESPFYYGSFYHNGVLYEGSHDPMISKSTYDQIQRGLQNASRPKNRKYSYVFSQLVYCEECGGLYSGDMQKGTKYMRCTKAKDKLCSNKKHYREDFIDQKILEVMDKLELPPNITQWILNQLQKIYKEESKFRIAKQLKLQNDERQLRRRLQAFTEKWLSPQNTDGELISDEEYKDLKSRIQGDLDVIQERLQDNSGEQDNWLERCGDLFNFTRDLKQRYVSASVEDKRMIIRTIGARITLLDEQAKIEVSKPFSLIARAQTLAISSEPPKTASAEASADFSSENKIWLRGWDSNPRPID
jgi:site-specific DNA recombinase